MTTALLLNTAINLVVGLALLLAWRGDRALEFPRWLGLSFVVQAASPPAFLAWQTGAGPWSTVGFYVLITAASTSLTLWMLGASHLAGRAFGTRQVLAGGLTLGFTGLLVLEFDPRVAQGFGATLTTIAGVVAFGWLRRLGVYERLAGALMVLLGLNQYLWVAYGNEVLAWQAGIASTLRVALGLALFHAAVSHSKRDAGRLRDQFMHLIERSHQGLAVMQGEVMKYANPALLRIYGLPAEDAPPPDAAGAWRDATMPEDDRAIARERHRRIVAGELAQDHWEGRRHSFDGRLLHLRFSAWRVEWDGQPAEQVVVTDDTAQFDAMQTLLQQATHDELTGLPNRGALLQRLRELCFAQPPVPFALLLLDVDRFKLFNEAHGHSVGDEVLRALAATLRLALAGRADVMRLGEDEFALLAAGGDPLATARAMAASVRAMLAQPVRLPRHEFYLDVSMGISMHPATAREPEALLRAANAAMHEAKRMPGISEQFAEERFERGSGVTLAAEQALRTGLRDDEFSLVYQPKVEGRGGRLVGFEALARWMRPAALPGEARAGGPVSPVEFIPAAERTGLIGPLGRLILAQACRQVAAWRAAFPVMVPVAVNVSPLQLLDPSLPDLVVRTLAEFGVPPALLTLEITESAAVTHMEEARGRLMQLREHGIEVALDDFGTGFSSLNMLRGLPLRTVKIDRSLIDPLPDPGATAVVAAICGLAGVLDLDVVAEGVETEAQAAAALGAGCTVMQGYLYARPLMAEDAAGWLERLNGG